MRGKALFIGLIIGVGACILVGPTIAAKLQWPTWVTYIVIGLDGLLLADVPYQFSEFYYSMKLRQGVFSQFADPPWLFLFFGLMPVLVFLWLVWQYLWIVPVYGIPFESNAPIATEAFVEPAATEAPVELAPTEAPVADFIEQETLTVSFQDGVSGTSTSYEYYGTVLIVAEGAGQAASVQWSDPFYIFTDTDGQEIAPWHPTEFYNWSLWINGEPVDSFIESIPLYNSDHVYEFFINATGGYLTFAVGDTQTSDNDGYFTITILTQ